MSNPKHITTNPNGKVTVHAVMIFMFDKANNFLLLHRMDNNKWEPPKGGVDIVDGKPEQPYVAAQREITEETGITQLLNLVELLEMQEAMQTKAFGKFTISATVYECKLDAIKPQIHINADSNVEADHDEYKWVTLEQLDEYSLYPSSVSGLVEQLY